MPGGMPRHLTDSVCSAVGVMVAGVHPDWVYDSWSRKRMEWSLEVRSMHQGQARCDLHGGRWEGLSANPSPQ